MKLVFPKPGEVIRYSYLWYSEQVSGREEGSKERPCVVMVAATATMRVWVLPITHAWPGESTNSEKIPVSTKLRLGLDEQESWVILDEINEFLWPGPDLRPVPGESPLTCSYGLLPASLYTNIRDHLKILIREKVVGAVKRTS